MKVVIVGYGIGNLGAIPNMLQRLGVDAQISRDPTRIRAADRLILPGVGAFDAAIQALRQYDLIPVLNERVQAGLPVLGLCLGMEIMASDSEEGSLPGLGWIPGRVVRFILPPGDSRRIPHMGWNYISPVTDLPLIQDLGERPRFYFAHSYHFATSSRDDVAATTTYGIPFASVIHHDNVTGIQFHPEKSHRFGLKLFENFLVP